MNSAYYGQSGYNDDADEYDAYSQGDTRGFKDRRHRSRSRSPLDQRRDNWSRERDRFSERFDRDSPLSGRGDESQLRDRESSPLNIPSIEYHHGLPDLRNTSELRRSSLLEESSRSARNERWQRDTPTQTIFIGGLPRFIEEQDIRNEVERSGVNYSDIRMVRHKDSGANRGFAFVEFHNIDDARRWMEHNQGLLRIRDQFDALHTVTLDYSRVGSTLPPRQPTTATGRSNSPPVIRPLMSTPTRPPIRGNESQDCRINDWRCAKCGCNNFQRREFCFRCGSPRLESEWPKKKEEDGSDQVGTNPCNTLLLRGLDALTSETTVMRIMSSVGKIRPLSVCVIRNHLTGLSRGYALVECASLQDSSALLEACQRRQFPIEIEGKAVVVSYSKNTFKTFMACMNQGRQTTGSLQTQYSRQNDSWATENTDSSRRGSSGTFQTSRDQGDVESYSRKAEPAEKSNMQESKTNGNGDNQEEGAKAAAAPDVNTFVFDDTSGYYYDASTGYYYDASTQYFFDPATSQFLYWNAATYSYLPAPTASDSGSTTGSETEATSANSTVVEKRAEKEKQAKKIAKDMERWAKIQNAQKESSFGSSFKKPLAPILTTAKKETATADAGFAAISKTKTLDKFAFELVKSREERKPFGKPPDEPKPSRTEATQLVASYGGDSDSEEEPEEQPPLPPSPPRPPVPEINLAALETKMTDWDKLTCLLCKRLFNTKDILKKHQQMSDLHKSNLEDLRRTLMSTSGR